MDLIRAARNGDIQRVSELLDSGADPNIRDRNGYTALIFAARGANIEIVKLLLNYGADPNITENYGDTAIMMARRWPVYGHAGRRVHQSLAKIEEEAARHLVIIRLLLDRGADPNIQNNFGHTALIKASTGGYNQKNIVELLLRRGADPNIINHDGYTALMIAERHGRDDIARLIRDHIHLQNLQRASQNLAFAKYFVDYDHLNDDDIVSKIFGIERSYDPSINIRMLDETRRDQLTKSRQRLASMRSMHSREGPFGTVRYDPSIMENISRYLSRIGPIPSVQERLMLEDRQTGSGRRRRIKQRKQRKKYTKNRF